MKDIAERSSCRVCGTRSLSVVMQLVGTPLANSFRPVADAAADRTFPLRLSQCSTCGHLQLADVVDPRILYSNYAYASGSVPDVRAHAQAFAEFLRHVAPIASGLVVEIASNDGTLLGFVREHGFQVVGVEPAKNLVEMARRAGVPTVNEFVSVAVANEVRRQYGPATVVCANNVLAHVDDLDGFLAAVHSLLADDGLFVFEVAYVADMFAAGAVEFIYHEHLSYFGMATLQRVLTRHGFAAIDVQRIPMQGGSLRVVASRSTNRAPSSAVERLLTEEQRSDLYGAGVWHFTARVEGLNRSLYDIVEGVAGMGRRVIGYGASARATTLLYQLGIAHRLVGLIDDSHLKQGTVSPGLHLPVLGPAELTRDIADYVLLFAWNYAESIVRRHAAFLAAGGNFIVPLPRAEVVTYGDPRYR